MVTGFFQAAERMFVPSQLKSNQIEDDLEFEWLLCLASARERAETIFQADSTQAAEEKLKDGIRSLRDQALNLNAIALKLGISRDRVSGLVSAIPNKRRTLRLTTFNNN
jgi:hypothetical protein